jgi:hypothetical protein
MLFSVHIVPSFASFRLDGTIKISKDMITVLNNRLIFLYASYNDATSSVPHAIKVKQLLQRFANG